MSAVGDPQASLEELVRAARVAEAGGEPIVAMRAWQRVLQAQPENAEAWGALAILHDERGDRERAAECRRRAGEVPKPAPREPDEGAAPTDADLVRFVHRFAGREDTHARMWRRGDEVGWSPVAGALTPELARAHIAGGVTVGSYVLRADGAAAWLVVDLDVARPALFDRERTGAALAWTGEQAERLRARLAASGVESLVEDSGFKGRHVWLFFDPPIPGPEAFIVARALASWVEPHPDGRVESFPRQPGVRESGLGNLVKLPLGLHLKSGRRSALLGGDPWELLRAVRPADPALLPHEGEPVQPEPAPSPPPPKAAPWTVADFETDPHVGPVLAGCPVLRATIEAALRERRIQREACLVLAHSLGHLPSGPRAVNYVFDHVPGFDPAHRMGAPHRGSVVSCARIRQRLSETAERVGCDCVLAIPPGGYAHPLLHRAPVVARPDPFTRWSRLELRSGDLRAELDAARVDVVAFLRSIPDRRWAGDGGEWVLESVGGVESVRWVSWPSSR